MSVSHNIWGNLVGATFLFEFPFLVLIIVIFCKNFPLIYRRSQSNWHCFQSVLQITRTKKKVLKTRLYTLGDLLNIKARMNDRNMSFSERKSKRKSMSGVNSGWSNYLLSLRSFQSECWAWLSEYNPLILFCSLIRKPGNGQMRLDRCWKSGLIFLIARCTSDTLCFPLCDPSLERKRNDIYLLEVILPFTAKKFFC